MELHWIQIDPCTETISESFKFIFLVVFSENTLLDRNRQSNNLHLSEREVLTSRSDSSILIIIHRNPNSL